MCQASAPRRARSHHGERGTRGPAPARALTRRDAKDVRLNAAQHVGDALGEVVRKGLLLEGRQAVGDHMPHPGQLPELSAHGGGGACRTKGGQEPGSTLGRAARTPTAPPRRSSSLPTLPEATKTARPDPTPAPGSPRPPQSRDPPASVRHFR